MQSPFRACTILLTILRKRLDTLLPANQLGWFARGCLSLARLFGPADAPRATRLREALQDLGPVYVKFGQLLSTRRDLLAADIADELAQLQDQVPPFDAKQAIQIVEGALGQPVDQCFAQFQEAPLASASVAQVHSATLFSGEEVVVKIIRPGIETTIRKDLRLLLRLAAMLEYLFKDARRLRLVKVIEDYHTIILDELDLKREAANCSQLRRNFEDRPGLLAIPKVFWDLSNSDLLVMERVYGVPVSDVETLRERQVNLQLLAERGVEIFFTQVFEHNFFHADMHPGNIFVNADQPADPGYIGIDCAIMGSLGEAERYYLARNLLAVFNRDYRTVAQLHIESGWVPPQTDAHAFEGIIRSACEPVFARPLADISFATLLIYLFQAAGRFGMEVQPSLVLLQKTLLNIEGLGKQLYPELDLWKTAMPYLENWMKDRYSPPRLLQNAQAQLPTVLESLPELPGILLAQLQGNTRRENQLSEQVEQLKQHLRKQRFLNVFLLLIAVLWLAMQFGGQA